MGRWMDTWMDGWTRRWENTSSSRQRRHSANGNLGHFLHPTFCQHTYLIKALRTLAVTISARMALRGTASEQKGDSQALNHVSQKPTAPEGPGCAFVYERLHFPACSGSAGPRLPAFQGRQLGPRSAAFPLAPPPRLAPEPIGRPHTAGCDGDGAAAELRVGESGGKFVLGGRRRV